MARVEAVFKRNFYLRSGDEFICVGEPEIGNGPLTLIGNFSHTPSLELRPGWSAVVRDGSIMINRSIRLALNETELWHPPRWPQCASPRGLFETCAAVARRAAREAPPVGFARYISGLAELSAHQPGRNALGRIVVFERWLAKVMEASVTPAIPCREVLQGLIGLGPGLTPSGDDFLVGALALLDAIRERDAYTALTQAISDPLLGLTSPLSAAFLRAAAAGHVSEALHRAVSSVITGDAESAVVAAAKIGHSSGWDMMVGVVTTLRIAVATRVQPLALR